MESKDILTTVLRVISNVVDISETKMKDYVDHAVDDIRHPISDEGVITVDPKTKRVGINTDQPTCDLQVQGSFAAIEKSFIIDHPTRPGMKLRHGSLEGPENGVYVRGRTMTHIIHLPDYWKGLVDESTITVHLTPIGNSKTPSVLRIRDNKIELKKSIIDDTLEVDCFYVIYGERKDVRKFEVEF